MTVPAGTDGGLRDHRHAVKPALDRSAFACSCVLADDRGDRHLAAGHRERDGRALGDLGALGRVDGEHGAGGLVGVLGVIGADDQPGRRERVDGLRWVRPTTVGHGHLLRAAGRPRGRPSVSLLTIGSFGRVLRDDHADRRGVAGRLGVTVPTLSPRSVQLGAASAWVQAHDVGHGDVRRRSPPKIARPQEERQHERPDDRHARQHEPARARLRLLRRSGGGGPVPGSTGAMTWVASEPPGSRPRHDGDRRRPVTGGRTDERLPGGRARRSSRMSAAVWYRSSGRFCSAFITMASTAGGTSGFERRRRRRRLAHVLVGHRHRASRR